MNCTNEAKIMYCRRPDTLKFSLSQAKSGCFVGTFFGYIYVAFLYF